MSYICVRGVEHYYEWIRQPEATEKKPVMVFIHGWCGSAKYWESTAKALANKFDCLLYDLRGFGRSLLATSGTSVPRQSQSVLSAESLPTKAEMTYALEDYAEDLAALLEALAVDRVYINGHSMGASIATFFLNLYPQRAEKAILTCSGIFEYDEKLFAAFHKFGEYVVKFRPRWLARVPLADKMFMKRFLYRPLDRHISKAFLADFLIADYQAALNTIFTSVNERAAQLMPQEFAKLTVPTLIVAGERDRIIPASMGREAAALNEKVDFVMIPNTGHFPMLEDAATYLQCVQEFLGVSCPVTQ
jgi:proline iminopeptidase